MNRTNIEYLDYTWNPIVGCSGLGCAVRVGCWAKAQAKRAKHRCSLCYSFVPHVHFERFEQPSQVKKPSRIGTCFMGEFFDSQIAGNVRASIIIRMLNNPQHTFIILTKQPQNIDLDEVYPSNLWIGVSVNNKKDLWRIDQLRYVQCSARIVSFEPLLEDLGELNLDGIDWVIVGAQTRPNIQPEFSWLATIFDATAKAEIPLFTKNNLKLGRLVQQYPRAFNREVWQPGGQQGS